MAAAGDMMSSTQHHGSQDFANLGSVPQGEFIRGAVKASDSDYVKLSKQGGEKDLLVINENVPRGEAVEYKKSEWFGHHQLTNDEQKKILDEKSWKAPDYMVYDNVSDKTKITDTPSKQAAKPKTGAGLTAREERILIQQKYTGGGAPFQTDGQSFWERKDDVGTTNGRRRK